MQTAAQPPAAPGDATDNKDPKVTASAIAWQFTVQYYTHMNDKPELLHRFYTKKSHYLHGIEGEETPVLQGQAAIHKKFLDIKFKECKVFIHSVDAQPSANNGIFVHVIGEMTNNGEPWRKFVQAFFLAEQTNGYYVLNDNFRYLKEEEFADEEEEEEEGQQEQHSGTSDHQQGYTNGFHPPPVTLTHVQPVAAAAPVPVPAPVEVPPPAPVEEPIPEPLREPTPEPVEPPAPTIPDVVEPEPEPEPTPPAAPSPAPITRKTPSPAPSPSIEPTQPAATTSAAPPATAHQPAAPAAAPVAAPAAPAAPKTWASLAATNSSKWGQNVAQEVKGVSTSVAQPPAPVPSSQPRERPAAASTSGGGGSGDPTLQPGGVGPKNIPPAQQHPNYAAALAVATPSCFVKGVTENVTQQALEQLLTQRFGPLKECEIVRSRACAFVEFRSVDSAKKAIIASLHAQQGGEGGIKIDEEKYGPNRIVVETRKERGDRPPPKQRPGEGRGGASGGYGQGGGQGYSQGSGGQGFARGRGTGTRGRGDGGRGGKA